MKLCKQLLAVAVAGAFSTHALAGTVTTDGADIVLKTKGGLELATTDKAFSFKLGGRVQADYGRFDGVFTRNGDTADAAYFRRAYIEFGGTLYRDWKYQVNYDLSRNTGNDSTGYFDEASLTYTGFDPLQLKFGRFYTDFGLEKATSSKWITGLERNLSYDLAEWVNDNAGMGVQAGARVAEMAWLSASLFSENNGDTDGDSVKRYNLRGVFAPLHSDGNVLHLGAQYAYRDLKDSAVDTRIRSRLGVRGVDTNGGSDAGDNGNRLLFGGAAAQDGLWGDDAVWGVEGAWANGPVSLQGEYLRRTLEADRALNDVKASGYYAQLAWTLTGEPRIYKLDGAKFDSIKPKDKALGAWEVFYRFDSIKVQDDNLVTALNPDNERKAKSHTIGVNWYLNEALKVSADYIATSTDNTGNAVGDDSGKAIVSRVQYVF
ncbi:OprO/OprP family phosphate-selective porin [Pseudomonas sp. 148P]|uniref:OprO/OprP family phosphate-selective porin n=1 Tax=Pseudomonas ulcerans TaxID=3115852 RepID=A0ABU7HQB1_9PSED|nr:MULTISPECIES: OprO/OprP family phosphate-selective porin [unclassified Pseudomonas]MEE1922752.1 OprO/OprP family phosphate-selective porin [Pseudomonas sp. 147P]MEE1933729.1 OprO/OprP family phosphate-selective porin [Pseudomonas sp. 148P]